MTLNMNLDDLNFDLENIPEWKVEEDYSDVVMEITKVESRTTADGSKDYMQVTFTPQDDYSGYPNVWMKVFPDNTVSRSILKKLVEALDFNTSEGWANLEGYRLYTDVIAQENSNPEYPANVNVRNFRSMSTEDVL